MGWWQRSGPSPGTPPPPMLCNVVCRQFVKQESRCDPRRTPSEQGFCRPLMPPVHAGATVSAAIPSISQSTLSNGLPLYKIEVEGTRSVTILVAFDAGARTERPEENGMAHFLEHLVFKGGEKDGTYRDVNDAATGIGAVLNAYTSHDLVAFHITARAERGGEAADLLTDLVARPRIDGDELNRERGVVVQEIARAEDQPATLAELLIDEAGFGEPPLGR